jgi:hypothetical protein
MVLSVLLTLSLSEAEIFPLFLFYAYSLYLSPENNI